VPAKPAAWAVSALCSLLYRLPRRSAPRNDCATRGLNTYCNSERSEESRKLSSGKVGKDETKV